MTALWTSTEAVAATGGRSTARWAATGVSIDTRTIVPGDLFVALAAERDGHDFVVTAFARGAAAAVVSHVPDGLPQDAALLIVPDVQAALEGLARAARARTVAKVVGITGSAGKTSTKEMLRVILGGQGQTHASTASYNNHWGVPLTLARMPADTEFAVIEIGMNHPGEIAPLARMSALDVAVITTVGAAHLEAFDSVDGIAHEKAAIMDGLRPGGTAILNADVPTAAILLARARQLGVRILSFGRMTDADYRLDQVTLAANATVVHASRHGDGVLFKIGAPGAHFAANGLAALAVADVLGCNPVIAACDLGNWSPPAGRGTRERIITDPVDESGFDLLDDAFNANPASMAASLDVLIATRPEDGIGRIGAGRRIAVLGDMLELGPTEVALHAAIAKHPGLEGIATIHCVGPRMRALWDILPRRQRGEWHEASADFVSRARTLVDAGDVILVKGSKGSKVSLVVDALRKLGQANATAKEGTS